MQILELIQQGWNIHICQSPDARDCDYDLMRVTATKDGCNPIYFDGYYMAETVNKVFREIFN